MVVSSLQPIFKREGLKSHSFQTNSNVLRLFPVMYLLALNLYIKLGAVRMDLDAVDIKLDASLCTMLANTSVKLL